MSRRNRSQFDTQTYGPAKKAIKNPDRPPAPTKQHKHMSVDNTGLSKTTLTIPNTFVPPIAPADTSAIPNTPTSEPHIHAGIDETALLNIDEIARGDDEDRQLEAMGLMSLVSTNTPSTQIMHKRKRTQGDNPLLLFVPHIDHFVEELLRHDGFGDASQICGGLNCAVGFDNESCAYRCVDCSDTRLYCQLCIVSIHEAAPLHCIQRWNGSFFEKTSLKKLGLCIQLGHPTGTRCAAPVPAFDDDFVVIEINGIHEVSLQYCGCQTALLPITQLLRSRFFPATTINPKTAVTFRTLEFFQLLNFMSKISAYEFYKSLERLTDNTGTSPPRDRYQAFLRMIHEWRHVRLLKRTGRGHAEDGVKGTKPGECALLCLACPRPGINIPLDYRERRPASERWLDALFIGIDANFRLKRLNVSNDQRDPGLNHGFAYVVEETHYKQYLKTYDTRIGEEKSTCNNHDAIKSANMRGAQGTEASGAGTVECSRHDMKRPTSVGDLQKGERYVNIDYLFLNSLQHNTPSSLVISYDISCQWSRNLANRCRVYPPNIISLSTDLLLRFLVPKFHLPAHIEECRENYSFNYVPGMGRTDGEAPERGWSDIGGVAASTKEMGPGSRRDTLDDQFGDYNWRKTSSLGETYVRKVAECLPAREEHVGAFLEFSCALPAASVKEWTLLCQAWEHDKSKPNPFHVPNTYISDKEVRLRLAKEEEKALESGVTAMVHHEVTPAVLIYQGLELEDSQRRLALEVSRLGAHATDLQRTKILERSNALRRKVEAWCSIQHLYMPTVALRRAGDKSILPPAAQDLKLFLPSDNNPTTMSSTTDLRLCRVEWLMRYAQAEGTLHELRGHILLRGRLHQSKKRFSRGQHQQTRSQALIAEVEGKVKAAAEKYRYIRLCLESLSKVVLQFDWTNVLRPLTDSDISGLTYIDDGEVTRQLGEGHKKLSWIWRVFGTGNEVDAPTQAALRLEWCKARARAHRWQEECLFLEEEMRRITLSLEWEAEQWENRALTPVMIRGGSVVGLQGNTTPTLQGKRAFAHRQASIRRSMKNGCNRMWSGLGAKLLSFANGGDARRMAEAPASVMEAAELMLENASRLESYIEPVV